MQREPLLAPKKGTGVSGRKVVIALDGGRLRIRRAQRGPKTKRGGGRYSTDWREPKLLIIYVTENDGRMSKSFLPIIDGPLRGPDSLAALLVRYLLLINIGEADEVLCVADGAVWIWERIRLVEELMSDLGVPFKPLQLIDFYHAAQHLHALAKLKRNWSQKQRTRWYNEQRRALKMGKLAEVLLAIKAVGKGSRSKLLKREVQYFVKNQARLDYQRATELGLPIGSGAIESAVRRVINLRLKSPCLYWKEETATCMLFLRSYYKSGRWEEINLLAYKGVLHEAA